MFLVVFVPYFWNKSKRNKPFKYHEAARGARDYGREGAQGPTGASRRRVACRWVEPGGAARVGLTLMFFPSIYRFTSLWKFRKDFIGIPRK